MGLLDAPGLSRVQGDARYPVGYRLPGGLFRGLSLVTNRNNAFGNSVLSNGTDTSETYRYTHQVKVSSTDYRLLYTNSAFNADGPNVISVRASVEAPTTFFTGTDVTVAASSVYFVTFNGSRTAIIEPGGYALSDPVPLSAVAGQYIFTRTYVSVASVGMKWPIGQVTKGAYPLSTEGALVGSDVTAATFGTATITQGTFTGYSPTAILGTPFSGAQLSRSVGIIGDSIDNGSGEPVNDLGLANRICDTAGVGYVNLAKPGEQASQWVADVNVQKSRMALAAGCTDVLYGYGRNDASNGQTVAQMQTSALSIWFALSNRGIKVRVRTVTPRTSTTDSWTTLVNQTVLVTNSMETLRVGYNTWVRDGAPIDATSLTAVAVGTVTNVLRVGATGHPVRSWYDAAAAVESAFNSGVWAAPANLYTDANWTQPSNVINLPSASLTQAHVGTTISVLGAGTAGALIITTIKTVNSATQCTLFNYFTATAVPSGGTVALGVHTTDGQHPTTTGHIKIAAAGAYTFPI